MTKKQMYNYMGYPHRLSSCNGKARYASEAEALAAMRDHQRQIVCDGMDVYWCWLHGCWHKGHTDKHWWNNRQLEESVAFFERATPPHRHLLPTVGGRRTPYSHTDIMLSPSSRSK